ncbi:uncharacterized protein LOC132739080 [Ruditapes philippinarum]|uniref:uncharacterized protein LOC132739080 n=1 Tax=Ruditapes philippinarum TaxID=129788 RepID=UPI00295A9D06|nr:uncharacterized protein LOC132739080 [Ruditapes philippinarum]
MANPLYANTCASVGFDLDKNSYSRSDVDNCVSFISDSTFCETDFENLGSVQSDRYGDYTHLSKVANSTQDAPFYDNAVDLRITSVMKTKQMKNDQHYLNSRSQHSVLYANGDMIKKERESVTPPIPRRKRRGQKIVQRISTIPASVRHEIQGWPRLKTAAVTLLGIVVGAGLVIGGYFVYNYLDAFQMNSSRNTTEDTSCKIVESLKDCSRPNIIDIKDEDQRKSFAAECSKISKKIIDDQKYIIYEDGVSFVDAMEFCHRIVKLKMLFRTSGECKSFQNEGPGYWIGEWCQAERTGNNISCWQHIHASNVIQVSGKDRCAYIQSNIDNKNETCGKSSDCFKKKIPVCKCY